MHILSTIFCILILLNSTPVKAGIFSTKAEMVIKVIDDNQVPVEGAHVTGSFRQYPSNLEINCVTDEKGICEIKGKTSSDGAIQVSKEGYYYSSLPFEFEKVNRDLVRYEPWGETYRIILKKKRNPIKMYAQNMTPVRIPKFGEPIGYDLQVGDWVIPYGKGKISDIIFTCNNDYKAFKDAKTACQLSFLNEKDGIQEYFFSKDDTSYYRWPFKAPQSGYQKHVTKWMSIKMPGEGYKSNIDDNLNYILRVRTVVDAQGNVVDARYGKILGDISVDRSGYVKFTYYFNPDGTRNLEFDPKQNLFKFSHDEYMNEVQRP